MLDAVLAKDQRVNGRMCNFMLKAQVEQQYLGVAK